MKTGIRLTNKSVTFMFELKEPPKKKTGTTVGIDIGQTTLLSCSNGYTSVPDKHGWDLVSITEKMCRKKKGSKAFKRAEQHRTNYINWSINRLNLRDVKEVRVERIKHMRKGRRTSRRLSHWTYTGIFSKLESKCLEQGVLVTKISPTYTSKRCSECGWTRRNNRKGKLFKCGVCGQSMDADLNASRNIVSDLKPIQFKERQQLNIKDGFFWLVAGQEPIVPVVQEQIFQ